MSDGQTEACEGSPFVNTDTYYIDEVTNLARLLRLVDQFARFTDTDYRDSNLCREVTKTLDRYRGIR